MIRHERELFFSAPYSIAKNISVGIKKRGRTIIKTVTKNNPTGKRPLDRPRCSR